MNSRAFCADPDNDHAIVDPKIDVRDNLGGLAIATLAARPDFSAMKPEEKVEALFEIVVDLHKAYDYCREHGLLEL